MVVIIEIIGLRCVDHAGDDETRRVLAVADVGLRVGVVFRWGRMGSDGIGRRT